MFQSGLQGTLIKGWPVKIEVSGGSGKPGGGGDRDHRNTNSGENRNMNSGGSGDIFDNPQLQQQFQQLQQGIF